MFSYHIAERAYDQPILEGESETVGGCFAEIEASLPKHVTFQYVEEQSSDEHNHYVYVHVAPGNKKLWLTISAVETFEPSDWAPDCQQD